MGVGADDPISANDRCDEGGSVQARSQGARYVALIAVRGSRNERCRGSKEHGGIECQDRDEIDTHDVLSVGGHGDDRDWC